MSADIINISSSKACPGNAVVSESRVVLARSYFRCMRNKSARAYISMGRVNVSKLKLSVISKLSSMASLEMSLDVEALRASSWLWAQLKSPP